jgi:hypothetical protein
LISTLTRFERRIEGPGSSSGSSSLNKVTVGSVELCCETRRFVRVDMPRRLFIGASDGQRAYVAATVSIQLEKRGI